MITSPYIGQKVILSESEIGKAYDWTSQVESFNADHNFRERRLAALSMMLQHRINGYAAKIAFGKLFDEPYEPTIGHNARFTGRGDSIWDFIVDGWTVKVSNTVYPTGKLIGRCYQSKRPADYYTLMVGSVAEEEFVFKGFMKGRDLFRQSRYVEYCIGSGKPAYVASQKELIPNLP